MDWSPPGSFVLGDSSGKNTGVGCQALLQEIFPMQGSNPGLLHLQADSLPSEPPGKLPIPRGSHPLPSTGAGVLFFCVLYLQQQQRAAEFFAQDALWAKTNSLWTVHKKAPLRGKLLISPIMSKMGLTEMTYFLPSLLDDSNFWGKRVCIFGN